MRCYRFILPFISLSWAWAQDSTERKTSLAVNGYIKNLESITFDKHFENNVSGNLLHHRLNVRWKPSGSLTAAAELRNRLFWGEEVRAVPDFTRQLKNQDEYLDLENSWIQNRSLVLHSNLERLHMEYRDSIWNARLGRQRINWGVATTWNPNDIFNSYNFLDFDYEERPGVDGARLQYVFNTFFTAELAYAKTGASAKDVVALKCGLNKWGYDLQVITGRYKGQLTLGAGWAGSIGEAGFKGELQYFLANTDTAAQLNVTAETDYMLENGWYLSAGLLYNRNGLVRPLENRENINLRISPLHLMPTRWNFIATTAREITPLSSARLSVLFAPGTGLMMLLPSLKYNLATNLDVDLVWQSFFARLQRKPEALDHRVYLRLKWSY